MQVSFYEEAVRDRLSFSCKVDSYNLKLYDEAAALPLYRTVRILSLEGATKHELQESKAAKIESVRKRRTGVDKKGNMQDVKSQFLRTKGNATIRTSRDGEITRQPQRGEPNATRATFSRWITFPEMWRPAYFQTARTRATPWQILKEDR